MRWITGNDAIFALIDGPAWTAAQRSGVYAGAADDRREGFLHLSTASQVRGSAARHRAGHADLWLVEVDASSLGGALRWEPASGSSRKGLFPHLFGPLPLTCVRQALPLPLGADGKHVFPPDVPPDTAS